MLQQWIPSEAPDAHRIGESVRSACVPDTTGGLLICIAAPPPELDLQHTYQDPLMPLMGRFSWTLHGPEPCPDPWGLGEARRNPSN